MMKLLPFLLLLLCPTNVVAQMQASLAHVYTPHRETQEPRLARGFDVQPLIVRATRRARTLDPSRAAIEAVLANAERQIGAGYRYGGTSPKTGFDCSGFVRYVFAGAGIQLPRSARTMAVAGTALPADFSALEPGDLVFLEIEGKGIDHVAIYAGNGRVIHSTIRGGGVRYDHVLSAHGRWVVRHLVRARRVMDDRTRS